MAARAGKGPKNNKTARVLSLITDPGTDQEAAASRHERAVPTPAEERANEERTENEIRSALEGALLSEMGGGDDPGAVPEDGVYYPEQEAVPEDGAYYPEQEAVPEDGAYYPEQEAVPEDGAYYPEQEAAPEEGAYYPEQEAVPEDGAYYGEAAPETFVPPEDPVNVPGSAPDGFRYINIMESLVRQKAPEYMERFHMCTCDRCTMDVTALALTRLPPKYVVVRDHEVAPRLNVFESRYSAEVTTQVMAACCIVNAKPHHNRGS